MKRSCRIQVLGGEGSRRTGGEGGGRRERWREDGVGRKKGEERERGDGKESDRVSRERKKE